MRMLEVYRNGIFAGVLTEEKQKKYVFRYDDAYFNDSGKTAISLTLPKTQQKYQSPCLFPFFFNMLSEGVNRELQCKLLKIDEKDHFGLLLATAQYNTIGAVSVKPLVTA